MKAGELAFSVAKTAGIVSLLSVDIAAILPSVASSGTLEYTIEDVTVIFRVSTELSFHGSVDVQPNVTTSGGCHWNTSCDPIEEALWVR